MTHAPVHAQNDPLARRRRTVRRLGTAMLILSVLHTASLLLAALLTTVWVLVLRRITPGSAADSDDLTSYMLINSVAGLVLLAIGLATLIVGFILFVVSLVSAVKAGGSARIAALAVALLLLVNALSSLGLRIAAGVAHEAGSSFPVEHPLVLIAAVLLAVLLVITTIGGSLLVRRWGAQKQL